MNRRQKQLGAALAALVLTMVAWLGTLGFANAASAGTPWDKLNEQDQRHALITERDKANFWTGRVNGESVEQTAGVIAREAGGTTLEMRLADRGIEMPAFDDRTPDAMRAWEEASRYYAEGASGTAYVVMGQELRDGNVWETKELPALKDNPAVDRIVKIDAVTREHSVLWERGGGGGAACGEPARADPSC